MKNSEFWMLSEAYLCPGDENGSHLTRNPNTCGCGNSNLASLARILDRETTVISIIDILKEQGVDVPTTQKVYRS